MMLNSGETFYTTMRVTPRRLIDKTTATVIPKSPSTSNPTESSLLHPNVASPSSKISANFVTPSNSPSNIPNAMYPNIPSNSAATPNPSQSRDTPTNNSNSETTKLSDVIKNQTKSDLPSALSFFFGNERAEQIVQKEKDDLNIKSYKNILKDHLQNQVSCLKLAYLSHDGWNCIVENYEPTDSFSDFQIYSIHMKAFYLYHLYTISLSYYDNIKDANDISKLAFFKANRCLGVYADEEIMKEDDPKQGYTHQYNTITSGSTLLKWFRLYWQTDNFPNYPKSQSNKSTLPFFLSEHPDAVKELLSYCRSNIERLSQEAVHSFLHYELFPKLVNTIKTERNDENYCQQIFLKNIKLEN